VAASVAFLATRVVSAKIGISSEPVTAGESLSPQGAAGRGIGREGTTSTATAPGTSTTGSGSAQGGSSGSAEREGAPSGPAEGAPSGAERESGDD
jgi:hypothetical protein